MAAIYIKYHSSAGAVVNLPEGADVQAELQRVQAENPGKECSIIGTQSFGAAPAPVTGPERDMMPGF